MNAGGIVPGMMMGGMVPQHLMALPGMQPAAQPGYVSMGVTPTGAAGGAPFGAMDEVYYQRLAEMQAAAAVDPQQAALMAVMMSDVMSTGAQFGGGSGLGDPSAAAAAAAAAMQALGGGGGGGAEAHSGSGRRRRSKSSHTSVGEGAGMYRDDAQEPGGQQSAHAGAGASRRLRKERCVVCSPFADCNCLTSGVFHRSVGGEVVRALISA